MDLFSNNIYNFIYIAVIILGGVTVTLTLILRAKERDRQHGAILLFVSSIFIYMILDFVTYYFMGEDVCRKKAGDILRAIRASKKTPGADRIYTAGEKEYEIWLSRKESGVPINESVQAEMIKVRNELGLTQYAFPWEK